MRSASASASVSTCSPGTTLLTSPRAAARVGVDRVARHGQLERDGRGQSLGQPDEAAGPGDEAPLGLGDAEHGVVGGHHQIAGEHDLEPPASAEPLTAAMTGLGKSRWVIPPKPPWPLMMVGALATAERLEIHAGAEGLVATAGDHDHRAVVVLDQVVEGGRDAPGSPHR